MASGPVGQRPSAGAWWHDLPHSHASCSTMSARLRGATQHILNAIRTPLNHDARSSRLLHFIVVVLVVQLLAANLGRCNHRSGFIVFLPAISKHAMTEKK
ncbi:unnamed protein product [Urochloa humidicola]